MDIKNIKFDDKDISNFLSKVTNKSGNKGWKIKVNGEFIKLNSGKQLWNTKGHAKSALKLHFSNTSNCSLDQKLAQKYLKDKYSFDSNKLWNHFLDFLQERGILEFVQLE